MLQLVLRMILPRATTYKCQVSKIKGYNVSESTSANFIFASLLNVDSTPKGKNLLSVRMYPFFEGSFIQESIEEVMTVVFFC